MRSTLLKNALLIGTCGTALAGCGGGGARPEPLAPAPVSAPAPAPTPTPAPTAAPTPTSTAIPTGGTYDDGEYHASTAAVAANAIAAYSAGATGKGVKIGIVDSGINTSLPEFAGRIDPASQDIRSGGSVTATGFHGNSVAAVAAAARNGSGIEGVAFDSTIIALNSANPNDCGGDGTCRHENKDIAKGVDLARQAGARVINISLGGSAPGDALVAAVQRATQAGIVVVFAAGNDGAANADQLGLQSAQQGGNGLVILAGALNTGGNIADFANRAGTGAAYYLMALGNGVTTFDQNGTINNYWGSSYAAPVVSGAVALIASAFPNMTGAQIIDLLFRTADDLGAAGVDSVYGHGALDLARAFQPQGQLSLAGSGTAVALDQTSEASPAMGDAMASHGLGGVILDGYSRAFAVDFAARLNHAAQERPLAQALTGNTQTAGIAAGPLAMSLTVARDFYGQPEVGLAQAGFGYEDARKARALTGYALGRVTPKLAVAFGFSQSGRALQQQLAGHGGDAFLVARDPLSRSGFVSQAGDSIAVRQQLGRIGLTVSGENGKVWTDDLRRGLQRPSYSQLSMTADRRWGPALLSLGASRLEERQTVLGGRFSSAFTSGGATSWFVDGAARFDLGKGWGAVASYRRGWTAIEGSGALVSSGRLGTEAWSLDLAKSHPFTTSGRLAFRVTQPLRVVSGGFNLTLPVSYDYSDGAVGYDQRFMSLSPTGREIDIEAAYGIGLWGGDLSLNGFARHQPGNIAAAPTDTGAAMRFTLGF